LWGAVVARPGQLKSYAIGEATTPLLRLAATARERYAAQLAAATATVDRVKVEVEAIKDVMKAAAKKGLPLDDLEGQLAARYRELQQLQPIERRYSTGDATVEKLQELLRDNPRGLLALRDELSGIFAAFSKEGREGEREFYLEAWNGDGSYTADRIGRGTVHLPAVTLSLLGGIQPGKLAAQVEAALAGGLADDGLLQRLQALVWPDQLPAWKPPPGRPDRRGRNAAYTIFRQLDELPVADLGAEVDPDAPTAIPFLTFADDAQELADGWRNALEVRLRSAELQPFPSFESHVAKYRSLMPSLALLFQLIDHVAHPGSMAPGRVSFAATRQAVRWVAYLECHARKLYAGELETGAAATATLAAKVESGALADGTPVREIYRNHWSGLGTPERVDDALAGLAAIHWLRVATITTRGRPSQVVQLHPDFGGGDAHG
jgi:putative DNA primase/helicase